MDQTERLRLIGILRQVFSPGAPIDRVALFAGRQAQVHDVIGGVMQRGQHVILYGERGVGKTSLANILAELTSGGGYIALNSGTINCDVSDNFGSLWHKVFRNVRVTQEGERWGINAAPAAPTSVSLGTLLSDSPKPDDVRNLLATLPPKVIIIIDELDRLEDKQARRLLADTIKNLSDHSVPATLILIGVADSVDGLIGEHASIERALVQVGMPRMSPDELREIIARGLKAADMTIETVARDRITRLSQGLPHYTHLLCLHAALAAVDDNLRHRVTAADVDSAVKQAVQKVAQSTLTAYDQATSSLKKKNIYKEVLLGCALARTDELGKFSAADVQDSLAIVFGKEIDVPQFSRHLGDFCDDNRGCILQRLGSFRRFRFRFRNPMMQPFVVLNGLAKGLITYDQLPNP